eukprot:jgi/Tetstr1/433083/TSEL_022417.t2
MTDNDEAAEAAAAAEAMADLGVAGRKRSLSELAEQVEAVEEEERGEGAPLGGGTPAGERGRQGLRRSVRGDSLEAAEVAASLTDLANGTPGSPAAPEQAERDNGELSGDSGGTSPHLARRTSRRVQQLVKQEDEAAAVLAEPAGGAEEAAVAAAEGETSAAVRPEGGAKGSGAKLVVLPVGSKAGGAKSAPAPPAAAKPSKAAAKPRGAAGAAPGGSRGGGHGLGHGPPRMWVRYERPDPGGALRALSAADRAAAAAGVRLDGYGYPVTSVMSVEPDGSLSEAELRGRLSAWKERYFATGREAAQRGCDLVELEARAERLAGQVASLEAQLALARSDLEEAEATVGAGAGAAGADPLSAAAPPIPARKPPAERARASAAASANELAALAEEAQAGLLAAGFPNLLKKFLRSVLTGHIAPSQDSLWWNLVNDTSANLLQQHSNKYWFSLKVKQTIYTMNMLPTGRHAYNLLRGDAGGGVDSWDVTRASYNIPLPSPKTLMSFATQHPNMAAEANDMAARAGGGAHPPAS